MKTPKRYQNKPIPLMPEDNIPDYDSLEIWCQRAKRKNRIKQLKHSLERYKEGTMLYDLFDLYIAYRWLQRLKKPGKAADSKSWEYFIYKLRAIRGVIVAAMRDAEESLQKSLEREHGKEQA